MQIYLTRWNIEETFRFLEQSYKLEDPRVLSYQRLQNLVMLVAAAAAAAAAYFACTSLGQKMKLQLLTEKLLIISLLRHPDLPLLRASGSYSQGALQSSATNQYSSRRHLVLAIVPSLARIKNGETPANLAFRLISRGRVKFGL